MSDSTLQNTASRQEPSLQEVFEAVWAKKVTIIIGTLFAAALSVGYSLYLPNIYKSEAKLAPKAQDFNGLSGIAAQYGGLASLAGFDLGSIGGDDIPKSVLALEKIQSLGFFSAYLYEAMLVDLFAIDYWDPETRQVHYDHEIFDVDTKRWVRDVKPPKQIKPSPQEAYEEFLRRFAVYEDRKSGVITISLKHQSPEIARAWLGLIIQRIGEEIRETDVDEAKRSIAFLEAQRKKTSLVTLDETFAQLIEEKMKVIMLASAASHYVFEVIDPPYAPDKKTEPVRALICILGTFIGLLVSIVFALFSRAYNRSV